MVGDGRLRKFRLDSRRLRVRLSVLVLLSLAAAGLALAARERGPWGPGVLAPGPQDLARELARSELLLRDAEAMGVASGRLQNRWAERLQSGFNESPCRDELLSSLGLRTRLFVSSERDAVQSARAQAERLGRVAARATVRPLVDPQMEVKIQALSARASAAAESWLERAAWQKAFVEPAFSRCAATLRAADGVTSEAARAPGEELLVVAVAGIGGGVICPSGIAADGRVVVLESPVACYGTKECDCALSAVLPGAVLGPELPLAEPPRAEPSPPTTPGAEAAPSPTPAPDDEPLD